MEWLPWVCDQPFQASVLLSYVQVHFQFLLLKLREEAMLNLYFTSNTKEHLQKFAEKNDFPVILLYVIPFDHTLGHGRCSTHANLPAPHFIFRHPSLPNVSEILTIKFGPTDIISKMMFFLGWVEGRGRGERSILNLCCSI